MSELLMRNVHVVIHDGALLPATLGSQLLVFRLRPWTADRACSWSGDPARGAADAVPVRQQSQDGQGPRPHHLPDTPFQADEEIQWSCHVPDASAREEEKRGFSGRHACWGRAVTCPFPAPVTPRKWGVTPMV